LNHRAGLRVVRTVSTFPQPLLDTLSDDPLRTIFEHGERRVSGAELLATIRRMAGALREHGLGRASGVAMLTGVTPEAYAAYIAAHALGCRVVGVRPGYSPGQLAHLLNAGIDAVVTDGIPVAHDKVLTVDELDMGTPADIVADGQAEDIARLVYTSGSTGAPKGCAWSYRAMSAHWSWAPDRWDEDTKDLARFSDRYLMFGTLASAVVQDYGALALLAGGTAVIPSLTGGPLFPYAFEHHRVTGTIMNVPRLYQLLDVLRTEDVDTSSLKGMVVAGSPLPPHRFDDAIDLLGPVVYQAYGQSEAGNLTMLTPAHLDRHGDELLASVGRPHAGVEIDIRDGELYVRNPYLMSGYWRDDAETDEVLIDGWIRTRDLGHLDEHGFVHLTGRAREVIIVDAFPYYAGPIEAALMARPDVDQAYVVGAPDEQTGEAVHAFVVPVTGGFPDVDVLRDVVRAELGAACVPKTITILTEVPVADSGKPDKHALRARISS